MKYQLALIYGGSSVEHEVSVFSALQIMRSIDLKQFDVTLVYYDKHQHFYIGEELKNIQFYKQMDYSKLCEVVFEYRNFLTYLKPKTFFKKRIQIDIALPLVHGSSGEDGTLQGFFETYQLPYCQSSVLSSAMGMDKEVTKKWLRLHQLPTLPEHVFYREDIVADGAKLEECLIPFPWILKPAHGGSSIGIQCADQENVLRKALECFAFDHKLMIEPQLSDFMEFNVAVLGDRDNQITSSVEQVYKSDAIYSYQDKYGGSTMKNKGSAHHQIPADISEELRQKICDTAARAFQVMDCSGVARIDFLYHEDTLYINEINLIPGSLSLYLFENVIDKTEVLNTILLLGFKRHRQKMREIHQIDSPLFHQDREFLMLKK